MQRYVFLMISFRDIHLRHIRLLAIVGFILCSALISSAQIQVKGTIRDEADGRPLSYAFVILQRTQHGVFADSRGEYSIMAQPGDSLLFSLTGYLFSKVVLSDTIKSRVITKDVRLKVKLVKLKEFQVKAPKTFEQILVDLDKAEKSKVNHDMPLGNALESPITYLYMQFSREGKAIRKISELRAEDAKQELLRDLFTRYMLAHIINLDEGDMDDFITFSGLKQTYNLFDTEYELVAYVKNRFADYKRYRGME
jgi:hypothetical protein